MGLKIQHLKGKVKSVSKGAVILMADQENVFGIPDIDRNDVLDDNIEWMLISQNKKDIRSKVTKKSTENNIITIDKLTSGSYSYHLKASYVSIKKKKKTVSTDSICISGYSLPKILNISSSITGQLTPGNSIKIDATLEGLNSNDLVLEIYSQNGNKQKKIHTVKQKCIEGKVSFSIDGSKTTKWKPKPKETDLQILIKLFDNSHKKYLSYHNSDVLLKYKLFNKVTSPEIPVVGGTSITVLDYYSGDLTDDSEENKNKVPFSFYRFGITPAPPLKMFRPKGTSEIPGYKYCKENMREGYIYIYYEQKDGKVGSKDDWEEYKVTQSGGYRKIVDIKDSTKYERDFREFSVDSKHNGLLFFDLTDIIWIAYSEQQWSAKYLENIMSDKKLREKRFQKLDVNEWVNFFVKKNETIDFVFNQNKIQNIGENWITTEYIDKKDSYADYYYKTSNKDTGKLYYSFCLNDPIGVADDLRVEHLKCLNELDAMLGKMPIENPSQYNNGTLQKELSYIYIHALTFYNMFYGEAYQKGTKEVRKSIEELRKYIVKKEFLEKILMVNERKIARDKANAIRTKIFDFVKSNYYLDVIDDMIENHPIRMEAGISKVVDHHMALAWDANLKDKHINIDHSAKSINQKVEKYLEETTHTSHKIYKLLSKGYYLEDYVFVDEKEGLKIGDIISDTDFIWANMTNVLLVWQEYMIDSITDYVQQIEKEETSKIPQVSQAETSNPIQKTNTEGAIIVKTEKGETKLVVTKELMEKWCGKVELKEWLYKGKKGKGVKKNTHVFDQMKFTENVKNIRVIGDENTTIEVVEKFMKKGGAGNAGKIGVPTRRIAEAAAEKMSGFKKNIAIEIILKEAETTSNASPVPDIAEFATVNTAKLTKMQKMAAFLKIFNSKAFIGFTGMLSVCNLIVVTRTDYSNKIYGHSFACHIAAISEVSQFGLQFLSFYGKHLANLHYLLSEKSLTTASGIAGVVSNIAMGVVSLLEAYDSFTDNNLGSGLLYAGAAAAFFAAGIFAAAALLNKPLGKNPYIIAATIIGAVLFFLGSMFKYTPMERYLANCVLQEDAIKKVKNWKNLKSSKIVEMLYSNKKEIVSEKFSKWRNLETSIEDLAMLLMNMDIKLKKDMIKVGEGLTMRTYNHKVKTADVSCYYKNLTFGSEAKYGLRVFYSKPYPNNRDVLYYKDFDGFFLETDYGCKITYHTMLIEQEIPSEYEIIDSYFFQRVKDGNGICFPPERDGKEIFFVQRIMINEYQIVNYIPQASSYKRTEIEDFIDYCMEKDKTAMNLEGLQEVVLSLNRMYKKIEKG